MALSIKNEEADGLARELAALTGESMTTAVTESIRLRLASERAKGRENMARDLLAMGAAFRARLDHPTPPTKEEWDALTEDGITTDADCEADRL